MTTKKGYNSITLQKIAATNALLDRIKYPVILEGHTGNVLRRIFRKLSVEELDAISMLVEWADHDTIIPLLPVPDDKEHRYSIGTVSYSFLYHLSYNIFFDAFVFNSIYM